MAFLPPAIFEIKAVADKAIAEFKQVNNELGKMENQSMKAGGSIGKVDKASRVATAGLLAMGAAFAGFAALGIKEAMQAETVMTKLNATLSAQGLNTASTRKEIDDLSQSFVKLGFDDEAASASMQVLVQSTGDVTKSKQLLGMAADLARAKTMSLEEASKTLVRANMGAGKVFKQFGIVLDENLPKAEATSKAMQELKEKLSGQAQKATETFAVQLQILKEQFNNAAQAVGEVLIPYLKTLMENLSKAAEFVKRNSTAFQIFGGIVLTVTVALASYAITLKVITAATKAYAFIQGVAKAATALLTGQQVALNGAMAVNPIGLVVMAVVALIGAFVILWNKSEAFRKIVITMAKAALNAFASIIPMVSQVIEAILKITTGPLRLLLKTLSYLPGVGKYAKQGLDMINTGLNGVSDMGVKAAKMATDLSGKLDKLNKPIKIKFLETKMPDFGNSETGGKKGGGLTAEQIKAQEETKKAQNKAQEETKKAQKKAQEEIKKANEDYIKIVKDLQDKIISAQTKFNEKMAKIDIDYAKETVKLNKDASEKIAKLNNDVSEKKIKAENDTRKKITEAQTRFNDEMGKLNTKKADDLTKLAKDNQNKIASITQAGNDKLQSIIQQSVDRLRNAFAKGTEFSVTDLFKGLVESGSQNAEGLIAAIKTKLVGAKQLAQNAAILQAKGFSQTFIEQIVGAGPEIGNQLAESLKNATPKTIRELQDTFLDMEKTQNHGLDTLAKEMNNGARLATSELNEAYKDAQKDLAVALTDQAQQYAEAQAEINKTFNDATAEAEITRDSAIASLKSDLAETIAEIDKNLQESIADVNKNLQEALSEAFIAFQEAQSETRKELTDTMAEIEKDMVDKLGSITNATKATIEAIKALAVALTAAKSLSAPNVTIPTTTTTAISPIISTKPTEPIAPISAQSPYMTGGIFAPTQAPTAPITVNNNVTVQAQTNASPYSIGASVVSDLKYNTPIIVGSSYWKAVTGVRL